MMIPGWETTLAEEVSCPYLEGQSFIQEYFFACDMGTDLWGELLDQGWRRFGTFFFRPQCKACQACTPLRIRAGDLEMTKSLRKIWNRNQDLEFTVEPLVPTQELFEVYQDHSRDRFGVTAEYDDFISTFFKPGAEGLLTTYRFQGILAAAGFLDLSDRGLSSVYFVFASDFSDRSLGIYSVLREAKHTAEMGLRNYYLGYWVKGNPRMAYKHRFKPREVLNWGTDLWELDDSD